jgi:dienelactone hydrolase
MSNSHDDAAALDGFASFPFRSEAIEHVVYERGEGPPVIVMHEMPGLSPAAARFASRLAAEGFHVYLPLLFGQPLQNGGLRSYRHLCVSREFANLQAGVSAPITQWLRALGTELHRRHGRRVGAIGMCLTGAFAILFVLDPSTGAYVVAQPGAPFSAVYRMTGLGRGPWMMQLNISDDDLTQAAAKATQRQLKLLAFRFDADRVCPAERMGRLQTAFGDRLDVHVLHEPRAWWRPFSAPHATLTSEYERASDDPDGPTRAAFRTLVQYLRAQL